MAYFIAIPLTLKQFTKIIREPYYAIEDSKLHITLIYLGNLLHERGVRTVLQILKRVSNEFRQFTITVQGVKPFPSYDKPKNLAALITQGSDILCRIRSALLKELNRYSINVHDRYISSFRPHITFAQTRVKPSMELYKVLDKIIKEGKRIKERVLIKSIALYESKGAEYRILGIFKLKEK